MWCIPEEIKKSTLVHQCVYLPVGMMINDFRKMPDEESSTLGGGGLDEENTLINLAIQVKSVNVMM